MAPVYENRSVRDGIVLPAGDWIDYARPRRRYRGPQVLDSYDCPLEDLPVAGQKVDEMGPDDLVSEQPGRFLKVQLLWNMNVKLCLTES